MKLALYSICTLLTGIKAAFRLARDNKIEFIEVFPYRGTTVKALEQWQEEFGVKIFAIDERFTWNKTPFQVAKAEYEPIEWGFAATWWTIFGRGDDLKTLNLVRRFKEQNRSEKLPYWLLHPDVIQQMGEETFEYWRHVLPIAVENERPKKVGGQVVWDPYLIEKTFRPLGCKIVLDPRHVLIQRRLASQIELPQLPDPFQVFRDIRPDILHLNHGGYKDFGFLPQKVFEKWLGELERHQPEFVVLEINPILFRNKRLQELLDVLQPFVAKKKEGVAPSDSSRLAA